MERSHRGLVRRTRNAVGYFAPEGSNPSLSAMTTKYRATRVFSGMGRPDYLSVEI